MAESNFSFETVPNSSSLYFRFPVAQFIFNMKRAGFNFLLGTLVIFFAIPRELSAQTNALPKFEEIYQLLRANGGSLTETELNRAAVNGLLNELPSRAVLVTNNAQNEVGSNLVSVSKSSVFENAFGYFRIGKIERGLNDDFKTSLQKMLLTNKLKGLVLDLRYASGTDYGAAAKIADLFVKTERPLLRWGENSASATAKTNVISLPLAILVNHQTSGAAEALAGVLREVQVGLIIGTNTAGQASVFKEFPLSNGQQLKIASAPVKLGNGREIAAEGLKADIELSLSDADEKAFYENPYRELPKAILFSASDTNNPAASSSTNRPRRRLNEAELVRLQREGISPDQEFVETTGKNLEPGKPVLSDPALVRALDLLKGLAVLQQSRRN